MTFFTPIEDGELGRAAAVNSRLQEIEDAILARDGSLVSVIAQTTLTADAASITMDLAITSYPVLVLHLQLRTNRGGGAATDNVRLTINDDGASTYRCNYVDVDGASITGYNTSAVTGCEMGDAASTALVDASILAFTEIRIGQANALTPKSGTFQSALYAGTMKTAFGGLYYPASVLITRIKLVPVTGTLFTAGAKYALYGTN